MTEPTEREFFDFIASARRRRRRRALWFIAAELGALAFVLASVLIAIPERGAANSFAPVLRVLPIAGATLAAIFPILFFGHPKRRSRWRS